jgi:hypothetical protein
MFSIWHWLFKKARIYPVLTGLLVAIILIILTLFIGYLVVSYEESLSVFLEAIEKSSNVIGWIALISAYTFAFLAWAHRKEAAISFYGAGIKVSKVKGAFDASLILASRNCQTEWHLRHIQPKRIELVWTPMVKESTQALLKRFKDIPVEWLDTRERHLENSQTYDIQEIKRHCLYLLTGILTKYPKEKVCVDLTAGTALMTIAAFQAAEELGITSIYLVGNTLTERGYIIDDNKVDDPKEAKVVIVSDHRYDK